jgi:membrane fusion protein, multidrug efflux system
MQTIQIHYKVLLAIACLLIHACNPQVKKTAVEEVPVFKVTEIDTVLEKYLVADIHAIQNTELRAKVSGFIDRIHADEGKFVQKNQLLFSINSSEYEAELAQARANVSIAQANARVVKLEAEQTRLLVEKNVVSKTELELALAKVKSADAAVKEAESIEKSAEIKLSFTKVRAPFSGLLDRIPLKIGSLIDEGKLLSSITDVQEVYAYFNVSEIEYLMYSESIKAKKDSHRNEVKLVLANGKTYPYQGQIETIEGEFNGETGSIAFRARFPNPDKLLRHGSTGKIILTTPIKDVLLIPQKCIFEIQDKNYVFIVDKNNTVRFQNITTQARIDQFYLVSSGVKPGDCIVFEGVQNMKENTIIKPVYKSLDSLIISATK